jgi:DNA-binding response OmpR family regulator
MIDKHGLNLTPNEFELLKILMTQPNRVFTRSELINKVQGYEFEGYDRTIDSRIKNLRRKIAKRYPLGFLGLSKFKKIIICNFMF